MKSAVQFKPIFNKTLSLLGLFLLVIGVWRSFDWALDISTSDTIYQQPYISSNKPVRYFGVVSRYTPREIYRGYQPIMDYLSDHTPFHFELKLSESYEGTVHQLAIGEIAIASLGSFIYVTMKDENNLEVILKPLTYNGKKVYTSMFITQDSSSIRQLTDLKGKSIVFPSKESLTGQWMPHLIFQETNITPEKLKKMTFVSHHTTVAEKVLKGDYDAGVVKAVVAQTYLESGLRIFHTAPPRPTIPLVVSALTDSLTRQSIMNAFLAIDTEDNATREMLSNWDEELSNGFQKATDSDYDIIRDIVDSLRDHP